MPQITYVTRLEYNESRVKEGKKTMKKIEIEIDLLRKELEEKQCELDRAIRKKKGFVVNGMMIWEAELLEEINNKKNQSTTK